MNLWNRKSKKQEERDDVGGIYAIFEDRFKNNCK